MKKSRNYLTKTTMYYKQVNKTKTTPLFIILVFCFCACSGSKNNNAAKTVEMGNSQLTILSVDELKSSIVTIPLSRIVENCELVQLESAEDAMFKPWYTTVSEKYIGIRQPEKRPYKLFNRSGKFLSSVGSAGQGPGEYIATPNDDIIDDENDLIYLAPSYGNNMNILIYETSGKFVKSVNAPYYMMKPKIFLSDGILSVINMPMEQREGDKIAVQFDIRTGKVLHELESPAHFLVPYVDVYEIFSTRNISTTFDFYLTSSDTLYHYDVKNNQILPVFTAQNYSKPELPLSFFLQYVQLNNDLFLTKFVDKDLLVATDLKNKTSSSIRIVNDYYGNIPIETDVTAFRDGYFVHNIQPEQLRDDIEKRLAESSCSESDRQMLHKILPTLIEGANNVVFIGKLRNEVRERLF